MSGNQSGITGVGALTSGSIASGFGTISTANTITTTNTITGGKVVADDVTLDGKVITITGSTDHTATFTTAADGELTIETIDSGTEGGLS